MQRVLKYPLLLKVRMGIVRVNPQELIKHTPDTHQDKQGLIRAHCAVEVIIYYFYCDRKELAKYINETKKDYDNLKNMISSVKQVFER